jgi:hypothetical protein
MEHFVEILLHAVKDTLPLLPWILGLYVVIQLVETKVDTRKVNNLGTKLGPVVGAATGLIPQCGFSVMAAKFFERKYITVGTLLAIFMATSDEAFILMLGSGEGAVWLLPMLAVKIVVGVGVGYAADGIAKLLGRGQVRVEMPVSFDKQPETVHDYFMQQYLEEKEVDANCSCGRNHDSDNPWKNYLLYPFLHALRVAAFIFLVNFVLTAVIHSVGEDKFASFMDRNRFVQPFIACAIGLIPNCASSVVLTETFLSGAITFGTCAAGLCANAGMGFVVLLRNTRKWKRNLILIAVCYAVSVVVGVLLNVFPILA